MEDFVALTAQMKFLVQLSREGFMTFPMITGFNIQMTVSKDYFPSYLASPVAVSTWLTQALYISTGFVFMFIFLSSMMSLTTGASSCLRVF